MSIDLAQIKDIFELIILVGIPLVVALMGIWKKKSSVQQKIKESVPLVWGSVQQMLRKNGGKLPNGKAPVDMALDLLGNFVKLSAKDRAMAKIALEAYHESQGAPDPVKR